MDMGGEVDDRVDPAQRRRPIRLRADVADQTVLGVGDRRLSAGPTLREDQRCRGASTGRRARPTKPLAPVMRIRLTARSY
jgi:hypothetical protein